jgi:hypothetical protein
MKIIDKTPFQNEKGEFGLVQRLQGMWEYGGAWYAELDAQRTVITQLDRVLEKGFTLIRNLRLENSQIVEPLILVGPPGVFVMYVTPISGFFEAKGDQWNVIRNDRRVPAPVNMLQRVERLARALQVYLNRQDMYMPGMFEGVLVSSNPAVHIDVLRPIVRVVKSDAIKQFGVTLAQSRPVLKSAEVAELVDHIIRPHKKTAEPAAPEADESSPAASAESPAEEAPAEAAADEERDADQAPARARAIFHAAEELKPFDPADLSFAFDEMAGEEPAEGVGEASPAQPRSGRRRFGGLAIGQWILLALMLLVEVGIVGALAYLVYFNAP